MPLPPLTDDLTLAYRLRPATLPARGLVLLLHGVGGNETSLAGLAELLPTDLNVALVRSPLVAAPDSYRAFTVNFTPNGPVIDVDEAEASRQKLIRFVAELQARLGAAPGQTLIAGFSQGGIMSAGLALTQPEAVAGFGILSGRILPEIQPHIAPPERLAHLRALIQHGEQDNVLPVIWAERSAALLQQLGIGFVQKRYAAAHEITAASAADFVAWVDASLSKP